MDIRPPSDGTFQKVASATPGKWDFKVARQFGAPQPDDAVPAGTTYAAATMMTQRPHIGGLWDAYVAAQCEDAGVLTVWQYFVASLPTTPTVAEGFDMPIWGRTRRHTYRDLITNTRPDRGDLFSTSGTTLTLDLVAGGTWEWVSFGSIELSSSRVVLDVEERDMGQGLCEVVVTTVASSTVSWIETPVDDETGRSKTVTLLHTLSATRPAAASVGTDGRFTDVTRQAHNHWLSVTDSVSMLPGSRDSALVVPTIDSIYWPAVLDGYDFTQIVEDDRLSFKRLLSYNMRDPFSDDVLVEERKWQQATPYTITEPTALIASRIPVDGHRMNFTIPECLHGEFTYSEQVFGIPPGWQYTYDTGTGEWLLLSLDLLTFRFSATSHEDWPQTITKTKQTFVKGVYLIVERIYHRPTGYNTSRHTIESRRWTLQDGWDMQSPVNTLL